MLRILAPPLLLYGAFPEPPLREFESRKFGFTLDQKAVWPYLGLKVGRAGLPTRPEWERN